MKQQVTRFEKSTPRQLAYALLGIGLIGLALFIGGDTIGLQIEAISFYIMLIGFAGATIFFIVMGGSPVPVGTAQVEVEDRVTVQLSDELEDDLRNKVETSLQEINDRNKEIVSKASNAAESVVSTTNEAAESAVDKTNEAAESMVAELNRIRESLSNIDVDKLASDLQSLGSLDVAAANEAIDTLQNNVSSVNNQLDDLSNISTREAENLENTITEVRENLSAIISTLNEMDAEVNKTLQQFEKFNTMG